MHYSHVFVLCMFAGLANLALAQQVVQLPTVGTFAISSSALVPDRGSASLGGVRSSASGSSQRGGLFSNVARGGQTTASRVSVSATIIDLQEMDRAILQLGGDLKSPHPSIAAESGQMSKLRMSGLSQADLEDVQYYLARAEDARRHAHWASIDVYVKLARAKIPKDRQAELLAPFLPTRLR